VSASVSPRVSVVIPTRNRPAELAGAVATALGQRDVPLEVIVVDDASPDSSASERVVAAATEPLARCIVRDERGGPAAARNTGIDAARAEWVAFLDDDDRWAPGKLSAQLASIEAAGGDWGWCATAVIADDGNVIYEQPSPPPNEIQAGLLVCNAVPGSASSVVARRDLLERTGGFDESFAHLADWELWLRLAAVGTPAGCEQVLVTQHIHPGGMHAEDTDGAIAELRRLQERYPGLKGRELSRWAAGAHWRSGRRVRALRELALGRVGYRG
jgi:glycosyltransferase involved in cell wall biosynthesis